MMTYSVTPGRVVGGLCLVLAAGCGSERDSQRPAETPRADSAAGQNENASAGGSAVKFKISSDGFKEGEAIPRKFAGEGDDVSPPLAWEGAPGGTKEFALICDDPDARSREPWVHWVIYGIGPEVHALPENVRSNVGQLTEPITAKQGENFFDSGNTIGYRGPMPPPGRGTHHYHFKLYALDSQLNVAPSVTKQQLLDAMKGHVLAETELIGTYER